MASKPIKIRRAPHDSKNPYFMVRRDTAQDKDLSYEALGMLMYILSKPDDWTVQPSDLQRNGCGKNRVYKLLKELIDHKFVERIINKDTRQRITSVEYLIHECPLPTFREMESQELEIPEVENSDITKYREEQNTDRELVVIEGKSKEPKSNKKTTQEPRYLANAQPYEPMIVWLVKKLRPEINVDFVGLKGLYKDMVEEYTAACETIKAAGLTLEDLPGEYAYLSSKGWPGFGIKKMAEYALDYAGHKTRQNGQAKPEQDDKTNLHSNLMLGGAEVA